MINVPFESTEQGVATSVVVSPNFVPVGFGLAACPLS